MKPTVKLFSILLMLGLIAGIITAIGIPASAESTPDILYVDIENVSPPKETWKARYKNANGQWLDSNGSGANEPYDYKMTLVEGETSIYSFGVPQNATKMYLSFDALGQHSSQWLDVPTNGSNLFYITGKSGSYTGEWRRYVPYNPADFPEVKKLNPNSSYSGTPVTPTKINSSNYKQYGFTDSNWKTYNDYYAITCADELYGWRNTLGNAVLINDIVVNTGDMVAAGNANTPPEYTWPAIASFSDTLDGRGHTISGLYIVPGESYTAMFEILKGSIKNLTISNTYVYGISAYNAVITANEWLSDGIINCVIDSSVKAYTEGSFGAFICDAGGIQLTNCVSLATIQKNGARYVGAFIGRAPDSDASFTNCYYTNSNGIYAQGNNLSSFDISGISRISVSNHTCIAMEHPETVASCFANGTIAHTDCMICDKILSGTKYVTPATHQWADATCVTPKLCTICGGSEGTRDKDNHTFDQNGLCSGCGIIAAAKVNDQCYISIDDAFAKANETPHTTLTLLSDVVLSKVEMTGTFTLDLNGYTLNSLDNFQYSLYVTNGHITIKDSKETGEILSNAKNSFIGVYQSASITVNSGTVGEIIFNSSGTATLNGGTIAGFDGSNGDIAINGGTYGVLWNNTSMLESCLAEDYYIYDMDGNLQDTREIKRITNVSVKKWADLANAKITLEYASTPYTALEKTPRVEVSINGRPIHTDHYTVTYTDNTALGMATVTVTGNGDYSGSNSTQFEITKGTLLTKIAPITTFEFGDTYVGKKITEGQVVINGNEEQVITGMWTWVEGTDKATFTPDAQYAELFETPEDQVVVTKNVTESEPVITLKPSAPSILPGLSMQVIITVENRYNAAMNDLPSKYRITYKVGQGGSPVTVNGLTFTIPQDVEIGETIYVTVENIEVIGKYRVGTSNTIELPVGQVDYSDDIDEVRNQLDQAVADLNQAIADLNQAIEDGDKALDDKIVALSDALASAKAVLEQADDENKANLIEKIETADAMLDSAIQTVQKNLDDAKAKLDTEIKTVQKNLDDAKTDLDTAIKNGDTALDQKIANLNEALNHAITALESADGANKTELTNKIKAAEASLQEAVNALSTELDATNEKVAQLETFVIIVCVISCVALCGSGAFVVWFFIDRKKKIE